MARDPAGALRSDIAHLARTHPALAMAHANAGVFPITMRPTGFPTLLQLILEQQVSTSAARAMFERLEHTIDPLTPQTFRRLDDVQLKSCGFSRQKIGYGRGLADAIQSGTFDPRVLEQASDDVAIRLLTGLRGIGVWTAENYLLWALGRRDVFPAGDLALQLEWQALAGTEHRPSAGELRQAAEQWRPRRSAAALLIWHSYLARRGADATHSHRSRDVSK